jgi:hypothetical protein
VVYFTILGIIISPVSKQSVADEMRAVRFPPFLPSLFSFAFSFTLSHKSSDWFSGDEQGKARLLGLNKLTDGQSQSRAKEIRGFMFFFKRNA